MGEGDPCGSGRMLPASKRGQLAGCLLGFLLLTAILPAWVSASDEGPSADPIGLVTEFNLAAEAPEGKVVTAGTTADCIGPIRECPQTLVVARYASNGRLDRTFDGDGILTKSPLASGQSVFPNSLAVDALGGVFILVITETPVLCCWSSYTAELMRLLPNGERDTSFHPAVTGKVTLDPMGRLLVWTEQGLARLRSDGSLDPTWGTGGIASGLPQAANGSVEEILPDGRVLMTDDYVEDPNEGGVTRLLPHGALDPSFGGDGVADPVFNESGAPALAYSDVAAQPDGRLVAVAWFHACCTNKAGNQASLVRFLPNGSLDPTFPLTPTCGAEVAVESDGSIINAGYSSVSQYEGPSQAPPLCVARYSPDGASLERGTFPPFETADHVEGIELSDDGSVLLAGRAHQSRRGSEYQGMVARYAVSGVDRRFVAFLPEFTCHGRTLSGYPTPQADVLRLDRRRDSRVPLRAGRGNDMVCGTAHDETIYAGPGADRVFAGRGDDRVFGGSGADHIFGGDGWDILRGGRGRDRLLGGRGRDRLVP